MMDRSRNIEDKGAARPVSHRGGPGGGTDAEARPVSKKPWFRGVGRRMVYSAAALAAAGATVWIVLWLEGRTPGATEESSVAVSSDAPGSAYSQVLGRAWSASHVDENGWTDLHYAAMLNRPDLVRRLLDDGAAVDARLLDDEEWFSESLRQSLRAFEFSGTIDGWNRYGVTPLHLAAGYSDSVAVVELLLDRGANLEMADLHGNTPLHFAAQHNASVVVVELLLDRGANLEAVSRDGITPLHFAASGDSVAVVELLLDRGASLEALARYGITPLHFAASGDSVAVVELLLDRGANLKAVDSDGNTPLHCAVRDGASVAVVELLLDRGANLEAVSHGSNTPLHAAAARSAESYGPPVEVLVEVVELLLARGADLEATNDSGKTPLDVAGTDAVRSALEDAARDR